MITYSRLLDKQILNHFQTYRQILILLGARQVGKTTLLQRLFPKLQYFLLDNEPIKSSFESYDVNVYKQIIKPVPKTVVLDEIQLLTNPGRAAKIIYDQMPEVNLIITGSSSLNIKNKTSESLAGRKIDYHLYPLTFSEYLYQIGVENTLNENFLKNINKDNLSPKVYPFNMEKTLENVIIYGLYPNLINNPRDEKYLLNLADSVVFKDILELSLIENKAVAANLLKLIAYQIGNLISYSELASRLNIDLRTVKKYIDIFEQNFIIFKLLPFSKNKRNEIGKAPKIYFYDTGLRNAIISSFSPLIARYDRGVLFENFIISEIFKANVYANLPYKMNYWRTRQGSEVDLVLEREKEITGLEIKYKDPGFSKAFTNRYPQAKVCSLNWENFYG